MNDVLCDRARPAGATLASGSETTAPSVGAAGFSAQWAGSCIAGLMHIEFLGAAQTVTGSKHLVQIGRAHD